MIRLQNREGQEESNQAQHASYSRTASFRVPIGLARGVVEDPVARTILWHAGGAMGCLVQMHYGHSVLFHYPAVRKNSVFAAYLFVLRTVYLAAVATVRAGERANGPAC